uniref:Phage late control D family protein n=1 Tax=Desulfobacca acetoxidans TaxID=60893 RepID=A0A7V4LCF1_9BACT
MIKGMHLTLMIGPAVPVPVPGEVLEALTSIQIDTHSGSQQSGFELNFRLSPRSPLHTLFLLSGGAGIPFVRVVIMVTLNGTPEVLMDGLMTHHQVQPGSAGGEATLTVQGKDLTALMTLFDFSGLPYPAMPLFTRVLFILAKYAAFGIVPKVIPSIIEDLPIPIQRIPRHQGTDLAYIQLLAETAGYVFHMEPGPVPGLNFAYWGPEIKVGVPQPALNLDMDAHTNVESLSFSFDKEKKELPVVFIHEPVSKAIIPIPIPDITPLNPPLGLVPPLPPTIKYLNDTARLSPLQAALQGLAYAARHADAVSGSGTLDVLRYGRVLKSRRLVGVRGAGPAFDGLYYVTKVTHRIKRGEFKQNFELSRNALLSTVPEVPV